MEYITATYFLFLGNQIPREPCKLERGLRQGGSNPLLILV